MHKLFEMSAPPSATTVAAAICLCGCLLCATAAPAPSSEPAAGESKDSSAVVAKSTEDMAVAFLHKTFYSNAEFTEDGQRVTTLIRDELKRTAFKFESISGRSVGDWEYIVRSLFMSYYLKQKSMSERVSQLLYDSLGVDEQNTSAMSKSEFADIIEKVPAAVISRVEKWNERPLTRKFEDVIFIGSPKVIIDETGQHSTAWVFTLARPMSSKRILSMKLGIHLTMESRERTTGLALEVRRVMEKRDSSIYKKLNAVSRAEVSPLSMSLSEEIRIDVTDTVKPSVIGMGSRSGVQELELIFIVTCPDCHGEKPNVAYMVMDCKVRVVNNYLLGGQELLSRETREAEKLQWPFDNTTTTEVFKNHQPGASFTKTQMCIIENVNRRYGQKSCCLMEFTYDMAHQGVVLAPKQLKISYCAGECHGQSPVHTPHSSLLQIVGHSQTGKLSHETKEDISLCCVANTYRDFQVLTVGRPAADSTKASVQLKVIKDISAESCTCA